MYTLAFLGAVVPVGVALPVVKVVANGGTVAVRNEFTFFTLLVLYGTAGGFTATAAAAPASLFAAAVTGGFAPTLTAAAAAAAPAAAAAVVWVHRRRSE